MLSGKFSKKVIHEVKRQLNERGFLKFYSKKICSPGQLTLYGMVSLSSYHLFWIRYIGAFILLNRRL